MYRFDSETMLGRLELCKVVFRSLCTGTEMGNLPQPLVRNVAR